jgi:hypothetical protein
MKKITSWAVASAAVAMLAACDVTVNDDADGGTTTSGTSSTSSAGGSAGSTSSTSTTSTGTGGSGTGGAGGSTADGGSCAPSANATECEKCGFDKCMPEICACNDDANCKGALADYLMCVSSLDGGDMAGCAGDFATNAASGAGKANDFASCMGDNDCENRCQGRDGGQ